MQTALILNHDNLNFRNLGQCEAQHRTYSSLVAVRHTPDQISRLQLYRCAVYEQ